MALWSTVIQRTPSSAPHTVEERVDTRSKDGSTYLWCDCPGWKFKVSRGGCIHVQLAREQQAAGQRRVDTPMTDEEQATIAAGLEVVSRKLATSPTMADPRDYLPEPPRQVTVPFPVMLAEKVDAPRGPVTSTGHVIEDGITGTKRFPILLREDLAFEPKWDGHRMMVEARGGKVRLWGRALNDITDKWPEVAPSFDGANGVFDGEVVVLGADGEHTFASLQNVGSLSRQQRSDRVRFILWDVLELDGRDVHGESYETRRTMLEDVDLTLGNRVVLTPVSRDGIALWNAVIERKLEGCIAKPLRSTYKYGNRGDWMKLKALMRAEFVVLGYTSGLANDGQVATEFGALLLGEPDGGKLRFVGKAGTGFTTRGIEELLDTLRPLRTEPPKDPLMVRKVRTSVAGVRTITWVIPSVIATVEFQDRGTDGAPRFPAFKSYRVAAAA